MTVNYTRVAKDYNKAENRHIKSIVNPKKVLSVYNPHFCILKNKKYAVTENYESVKGYSTRYNSVAKIRINHYHCKSEEEYKIKTARGNADSNNKRKFINEYLNFPEVTYDYAIQKYLPELKKRMNISEEVK